MSLFGGGHKSAAQTPTRAMGLDLQGAQYGPPIPVVFGRNKLAANVIDYFEFQAIAHTQKQQGGKGGGGGGQTSTSYTYSVSYLLGLHEGVGGVVNVYDGSSVRSLSSVGGLAFSGAQGQAPWSHLSGDAALGYSGTVLVAFQNKDLGSSASLPNYNFEVDGRNQFSATIKDANPSDIVTAICTDSQIGINFTALGDLTAFRNYCTAAGIFFSPVYDTQNPAQSTLEDLFKYANSAPFFSEGKLKVVPYCDQTITGNGVTYTPNLTAVVDLGRDDFITNGTDDPVTLRRVAPADAMNIVRLEYKDRANTYHTMPAVASFDQDVVGTGSRGDQSESVDMITDGAVARLVVQNLLQRNYYIRNTYDFQLSWRYCDLEPMDIVTLTDGNTGLYLTTGRIIEIGEDEHGLLQATVEEFPQGVSHASTYAIQPNVGTGVDPNATPGPITSPYLFRGPGFLVSNNQPEIWAALSGVDPMWAGCDVYLSQDGTSYTYLTTHSRRAAYGNLTNSLATGSDPDTTGTPNVVLNGPVELLGGTQADADQFITLAMIDNEIMAYQTATLAAGPSYTLGYLRRGGYGTAQAVHTAGAPFVRLDENILRIPVDPSQIGQTVYLKFVSFNVFGKGGRTLADETAYTYVVGTNMELPDVPVTPASPAVTGVADGNSITWFNPNPAAVGCTSIEYATASGGPWTVLAQVGPTSTSYVHHFTTGATYYYRLHSRGPVVSGGWSAYTAVISGTGTNVGAISAAAASAQTAANAANAALANIASDNVLSAGGEKSTVIQDYAVITGEQAGIDAQATAYGITTEKTAYDNAVSALTTYLGGLTSPTAWNSQSGNTTIVGATFRANFASVYSTRQALLNAIYAAAKAKADAAQATANTATGQVSQLPVINGGFDVAPTGYGWTADSGTGWFVDTTSVTPGVGPNCARHTGGVGSATGAYRNNGLAPCGPGQVYKAQALIKAVGANGVAYVMISWCDAGGGEIGTTTGNFVTGTTTAGSYAAGQAPPGTVYARTCLAVSGHTAGYYALDNVVCTQYPSSMDDVPDGTARFGAVQAGADQTAKQLPINVRDPGFESGKITTPNYSDANGTSWHSESGAGDAGWLIDSTNFYSGTRSLVYFKSGFSGSPAWVSDTILPAATQDYFRVSCKVRPNFGTGTPTIILQFLGASGYLGQTPAAVYSSPATGVWGDLVGIGGAPAGTTQCRVILGITGYTGSGAWNFDAVQVDRLTPSMDYVPDGSIYARINGSELSSGVHKLGVSGSGARLGDMRNQVMAGVGNYASGWSGGSVTYSATSTSATITAAAASLQIGSTALSYNASNVTVSGTAGTTRVYYLYYDDPGYTGGSKTLNATTSQITSLANDGRLLVGTISVTFPTSGTGGGGGNVGCPQVDEPVVRRAPDGSEEVIRAGDVLDGDYLRLSNGRWGRVTYSKTKLQPGVRVTGADGSSITCSTSAPLETAEGQCVPSLAVRGLLLRHRTCGVMRAVDVIDVGDIWVQHITCENDCFWVADYSHHNLKPT